MFKSLSGGRGDVSPKSHEPPGPQQPGTDPALHRTTPHRLREKEEAISEMHQERAQSSE